MNSKLKPGSIASEAARLTEELGFKVTPDQVRWWRKKQYDLSDTHALRVHLGNQERVSTRPAVTVAEEDEGGPPALSFRLITDEMIANATGSIPVSAVLRYLRDHWEADEWHRPALYAKAYPEKSEPEIASMIEGGILFEFGMLPDLLPIRIPGTQEALRKALGD